MNDKETEIFDFRPIPFQIRIGVTGHRQLKHPGVLRKQVTEGIDTLLWSLYDEGSRGIVKRVKLAGTTPVLYRILSSLAEGADRMVAGTVLEYPQASLSAVLPLTVEDYLDDFATAESKREFREFLSKSNRTVLLRKRNIGEDRRDPQDQRELRRQAYEAAGRYVVDHSDLLIAVWDGAEARGRGGTAEIVRYALSNDRPVIQIWEHELKVLNRGESKGLDASAIEGIDTFNRQSIVDSQSVQYASNLERDIFEKPRTAASIPAGAREMVSRCLFPYYVRASVVAKKSRDAFQHRGRNVYVLSAAAVGCAATAVLFPPLAVLAFGTELALLIAILLTLRTERNAGQHRAWIEHRFLTERLRAGIFMAICGVDPSPINVPAYMGHSQTVNDWTVRAFQEIWHRLPPFSGCDASNYVSLNAFVREAWIEEQTKFHRDKQEREGRIHRRLARAGSIVVTTTVVAAAAHIAFLLLVKEPAAGTGTWPLLGTVLHHGLAFVALLFPAIAASLSAMDDQGEHRRLEERSKNMKEQLERLGTQMASARNPEEFEKALRNLDEQLMLRETQDWLMLMRYVEIKAG
jgi:hypothetical protein